jgi:hypothetical protein
MGIWTHPTHEKRRINRLKSTGETPLLAGNASDTRSHSNCIHKVTHETRKYKKVSVEFGCLS